MPVPVIFRVKLGKTGNSLRITVPQPVVEGFGWKEKDEIVLYVTEQEITLRRLRDQGNDEKLRHRPPS
ncbi:MAG: AbrB/MazE/SpoVT family DNA-binding domain-containing protein [Thaumarchaeota archaeon]|nr:AbrB/MazE/SpoVT family DNA-binding domain-containing protein [Nitrososphaerota archaeon]